MQIQRVNKWCWWVFARGWMFRISLYDRPELFWR